jgi:tetratricopeptide (TPR) repeat protein
MKHLFSPEKHVGSGLSYGKNTRLVPALMTIALVLVSSFTFAQSPEVRKAYRLIDIEQPSKGISALEQLANGNAANTYYLGIGYMRTGDTTKALSTFEKGIGMEEKNGLNYAGKGHVLLARKNATEAKAAFDKALAVSKSKDANVLKAVAEGYLADSKFVVDAINLLNKAKGMNGSDPEVHMLLGRAYLAQNNGGESVSSYERAASADKSSAKPFVKIAEVYQRSKNYDMVLDNLNKAIAVDAEYAPAYKKLGEIYYVRKQADKAVEAYEKYLTITEKPGDAKFQLAFFYFMAKRFDKANQIFKEVTNSPNASPTALKYYAYTLIEGDTTRASAMEAQKILDRYLQQAKPEDVSADDYAYYGKLLVELKQDSLANENFAKSLDLDSAQADVLQLHGDTYFKRKKFQESAEAFKQLMSIRKQPLSQDLWSLGRAQYYSGNYPAADSAFTQLSEKQPKVTHGYLWAAKARAQIDSTGSSGIAVPMYEKFIEIASQAPEKNKKDLIDAYDYMGQYALHKKDNVAEAKTWFEKILTLDPTNARAKEFMNVLKQANQPQKGGPNPGKK